MAATKTKYRDEDLFKDSTMTFGEHLEELRSCLIKAIVGMVLVLIVVFVRDWATDVVNEIQSPLKGALEEYYARYSQRRMQKQLNEIPAGMAVPDYHRLVDAVTKDGLAPSIQFMDVRETLRLIQKKHAPQLNKALVEQFAAADFLDIQQFCQQLVRDSQTEDHPAAYLWSQFSEDTRKLVTEGAEGALSDAKQLQLAADLAKVLQSPDFAQENQVYFDAIEKDYDLPWWERFSDLTGNVRERVARAKRVKELRESHWQESSSSPEELNRQLLAVVYPEAIAAGPRFKSMVAVPFFQRIQDDPRINPKSLSAQEMFIIWMKAAILLSLVIASPWVLYQLWSFVAAGLYPHEKRYVYLYLPFSLFLFLAGVGLCFYWVLPLVLKFLFVFNDYMNVDPDIRISEWFGFALFLPLGFGVAFQLPLVMLFLQRIGVMTIASYLAKWRIAVLIIAIASSILTPSPDPYSMLMMAGPLVMLYFGGILLCKYMPRRRSPFAETEETT
jgi:sec-independent protein translocase protein TatC